VALGGDHTVGAEGRSRSQYGADIVGIGHLVEHDEKRVSPAFGADDEILQEGLRQRLDLKRDALMNGIVEQLVEGAPVDHLQDHLAVTARQGGGKPRGEPLPPLGSCQQAQAAPLRIRERG
jgi:hypothetical protein